MHTLGICVPRREARVLALTCLSRPSVLSSETPSELVGIPCSLPTLDRAALHVLVGVGRMLVTCAH